MEKKSIAREDQIAKKEPGRGGEESEKGEETYEIPGVQHGGKENQGPEEVKRNGYESGKGGVVLPVKIKDQGREQKAVDGLGHYFRIFRKGGKKDAGEIKEPRIEHPVFAVGGESVKELGEIESYEKGEIKGPGEDKKGEHPLSSHPFIIRREEQERVEFRQDGEGV